jgi:hypothetical protein
MKNCVKRSENCSWCDELGVQIEHAPKRYWKFTLIHGADISCSELAKMKIYVSIQYTHKTCHTALTLIFSRLFFSILTQFLSCVCNYRSYTLNIHYSIKPIAQTLASSVSDRPSLEKGVKIWIVQWSRVRGGETAKCLFVLVIWYNRFFGLVSQLF